MDETPLYKAAFMSRKEVIPALKAAGADPNFKVNQKLTFFNFIYSQKILSFRAF